MPSLDYIFKNDYSNLRTTNVDVRVTDFNDNETLSAYSGGIGKLTFTPKFIDLAELGVEQIASSNNFIIDLGDGTISKSLSTVHFYKNAGEYEVKIIVVDKHGALLSYQLTKKIKVNDIIPDTLYLTYGDNFYSNLNYLSSFELKAQPVSTMAQELLVTRYNTTVSSKILEENDYKINLSVDGNLTEFYDLEKYNNDRDFQLKKASFFCDRKKDFKVIDSVSTTNENIFAGIKINENSDNEIIVKPEVLITDEEREFTTLVGTSGTGQFYYYEDAKDNLSQSSLDFLYKQYSCLPSINYFIYDENKFYINEISTYGSGVGNGNYILKNVPIEYPITIINKNTNIQILTGNSETYYGSKKVIGTENDGKYNFYYGDVSFYVERDFGFASIYTFFDGYFGGENILQYKSDCAIDILENEFIAGGRPS